MKTGVEKCRFRSEIGLGFGEPEPGVRQTQTAYLQTADLQTCRFEDLKSYIFCDRALG